MAYTVLARKYRPQRFDQLVGQQHVARTLSNAIATDRVAHAFLLTGQRGVGKTTTARLLAKALCCEQGPAAEPCNECAPCVDIANNVDMDVLEIDGASNNGVDDVRRLQETLPYRPARNRYKIVIVDEVHMLSQGAFNAFLKTLEEPPEHVKFIFATTEAHKVPLTIRSRCQRYDFRLIPQSVIADKVREILRTEEIEADDGAVVTVSREAAGSMRDALTLLDQLVAFTSARLEGQEVARVLGIADRQQVFESVRASLQGDGAAALRAVTGLAQQGADMVHASKQLVELLRNLVVLRVAGDDGELVDLVEEERRAAQELAEGLEVLELQRAFHAVSKLVDEVARSSTPRTVLEMGLVRVATRPPLRDVGELLGRVAELEQRLDKGGSGAGSSGGRRGGSRGGPARRSAQSRTTSASGAPSPTPSAGSSHEPAARETRRAEAAASEAPAGEAAASEAPAGPSNVAPPKSASEATSTAAPSDETDSIMSAWERIVTTLRDHKPALAAVLEHGRPVEVTSERIVVGFEQDSFYGRKAEEPDATEGLAQAAAEVVGHRPQVRVTFDAASQQGVTTVAQAEASRRDAQLRETETRAWNHPLVREALEIFPEGKGTAKVDVGRD